MTIYVHLKAHDDDAEEKGNLFSFRYSLDINYLAPCWQLAARKEKTSRTLQSLCQNLLLYFSGISREMNPFGYLESPLSTKRPESVISFLIMNIRWDLFFHLDTSLLEWKWRQVWWLFWLRQSTIHQSKASPHILHHHTKKGNEIHGLKANVLSRQYCATSDYGMDWAEKRKHSKSLVVILKLIFHTTTHTLAKVVHLYMNMTCLRVSIQYTLWHLYWIIRCATKHV